MLWSHFSLAKLRPLFSASVTPFIGKARISPLEPISCRMSPSNSVTLLPEPHKGISDKKLYRSFVLPNGIKVMLISDHVRHGPPSTPAAFVEDDDEEDEEMEDEEDSEEEDSEDGEEEDDEMEGGRGATDGEYKAAASLSISWGSFEDPVELPGLMHFLEHMVFMGSEKYPKENSFDDFIQAHGGHDNAYTDCEHTNFYFDVHEAHFQEALDRFAQFFISPLMKKNAMERERNAVDSECTMAQPSDDNREYLVVSGLAPEGHPCSKFSWGNAASLSQLDDDTVHDMLHQFRKKCYSSQFMALSLQSRHSLDTMQEWVTQIFSQVPRNNLPQPDYSTLPFPFPPSSVNKVLKMEPMTAKHVLATTWFLPPMIKDYRRHPLRLLAHLLGHEGPGSLLSFYKHRNWSSDLECDCETSDSDACNVYTSLRVVIGLTEEGFKAVDQVLFTLFQYTAMLAKQPPSRQLFQEFQTMARLQFDYEVELEPFQNVESLSAEMLRYPPEDFLRGSTLLFDYDPQFLSETIARLNPENVLITLRSKLLGEFTKDNCQVEKWFGAKYRLEDIKDRWRSLFSSASTTPNPALHMPLPNNFIPSDFTLIPSLPKDQSPPMYPSLLIHEDGSRLYHKADHKFGLPMVQLKVQYLLEETPDRRLPEFASVMSILLQCFRHQFMEYAYGPSLARFSYSIEYSLESLLCLTISGFSQHIRRFMKLLLDHLHDFSKNFDEEHFKTFKDLEIRAKYNSACKPSSLQNQLRLHLLLPGGQVSLQQLQNIPKIRPSDVLRTAESLFCNAKLAMLVQGNISGDDAKDLFHDVQKRLVCNNTDSSTMALDGYRILRPGVSVLRVNSVNKADGNSAITNYYQGGKGSLRTQVLQDFILSALEERCFNFLRTQEQLGYHTYLTCKESSGVLGFAVSVVPQAEKFKLDFVDSRIEAFLASCVEHLSTLTDEAFATIQDTVRRQKKVQDHSLGEEFSRHFVEIAKREYLFERYEKHLEIVESITKEEMLSTFLSFVNPEGTDYRKLSVQVVGCPEHDHNKAPPMEKLLEDGFGYLEFLPQGPEEQSPSQCPSPPTFISSCQEYIQGLKAEPFHPVIQ